MLYEIASAHDVQELEAAADRERRHVALERGLQKRQLAGVPPGLGVVGLGMRVSAVPRRIDVRTTGEDDSVQHASVCSTPSSARRHEQRASAGALDGVDVAERDERSG